MNKKNETLQAAMNILSDIYQGKGRQLTEERVEELEQMLAAEEPYFTEEQHAFYNQILDLKEGYQIHNDLNLDNTKGDIVRFFSWSQKHPVKAVATIAASVASISGSATSLAHYSMVNGPSIVTNKNIESDKANTIVKEETIDVEPLNSKNIEEAEPAVEEQNQVKSSLTEEKIREVYANNADVAANIIKTARTNGLALEADEMAHLMSIANLHNLTNDQKYELASARHPLTIEEWMNFSDKVKNDLIDVTEKTLAFDAKLLFGDTQDAKDANYIMRIFAKWNTTHDSSLRKDLKNFLTSYTKEETFKQKLQENPAAAEFVLNACSLAANEGINLLDNDEFNANLFNKEGCKLSEARMALGADLQIDQRMFKDNAITITDESMTDTDALQRLTNYDENQILQIKFVANQMNLTSNQEQDLANKLKLEQTLNTWRTFGNDYAQAIKNGVSFDAKDLFLNNEKAAKELNKAQAIYQKYLQISSNSVKNDGAKAELYDQWNELYYRNFANDQKGLVGENKPAAYLLAQLLQKASADGLTLEKADSLNAKDKNGTIGLYKIIVGEGLSNEFCNTMKDITVDELGNEISNRTFWEESYADIANAINSVTITADKGESRANTSLYEQIVLEGRATTEIEEHLNLNRHDIFVRMIEEKVKDIKLQNVTNPEDVLSKRIGAAGMSSGGYDAGSGSASKDVTVPDKSGVKVQGEGSEIRDKNLELWTTDQVKEAEKKAKSTKNEVVDKKFEKTEEKVVEEEKTEEIIFTEKDKQDNDDAADKGYITDEERDELNENQEHIVTGDIEYIYDNNLSSEDIQSLTIASNKFAEAQNQHNNGQISEEDYQKAVEEFDKITNEIFDKYQDQSTSKEETPSIDNPVDKDNTDTPIEDTQTPNTPSTSKEDLIKIYGIDVNNSFEYEGVTFYYSETEKCYVDLNILTLPNQVVDTKMEETDSKVVEETIISAEGLSDTKMEEKLESVEEKNNATSKSASYIDEKVSNNKESKKKEKKLEEAVKAANVKEEKEVESTNAVEKTQKEVESTNVVEEAPKEVESTNVVEEAQKEVESTNVVEEVQNEVESTNVIEETSQDTASKIQELEALKEQITTPVQEETQTLGL